MMFHARYVDSFRENQISGKALRSLTMEELRDDLDIKAFGPRKAGGGWGGGWGQVSTCGETTRLFLQVIMAEIQKLFITGQ